MSIRLHRQQRDYDCNVNKFSNIISNIRTSSKLTGNNYNSKVQ